MVTTTKKSAAKASAVSKAAPRTAVQRGTTGAGAAAAANKPAAPGGAVVASPSSLVVQVPESKKPGAGKRQRLSKAFSRPLDKKLRKAVLVRERFTLPETEYEQLVALKKRLALRDIGVKKSELVRAGLLLIGALDDEALQALLAKVPRLD